MVTIREISKKAGVSQATVSKALNGYTDINPVTAERIRQIAREMHYRPNAAARMLKSSASHNIGVLFVDETQSGLTHEYFSSILNSAKNTLEEMGYDITFINHSVIGETATFLEHARYRRCDGVLVASVDFLSPEVIALVNSEVPTVTIDFPFDGKSAVMSDNVNGCYELARHLLEKGHRKIAFIHGEETLVTKKRLNGFYRAMREQGLTVAPRYVTGAVFHDPKSSAAATRRLMEDPDPPTAILYPDDFSYLGGMGELERMGISVPEDVSVAGYDGIMLSQALRPRLTTWYQDSEEIGRLSARKLVETIEDPENSVPEQILVKGRLLPGDSVKDISGGNGAF